MNKMNKDESVNFCFSIQESQGKALELIQEIDSLTQLQHRFGKDLGISNNINNVYLKNMKDIEKRMYGTWNVWKM